MTLNLLIGYHSDASNYPHRFEVSQIETEGSFFGLTIVPHFSTSPMGIYWDYKLRGSEKPARGW